MKELSVTRYCDGRVFVVLHFFHGNFQITPSALVKATNLEVQRYFWCCKFLKVTRKLLKTFLKRPGNSNNGKNPGHAL
ncbi:hypothetical protein C5167_034732 [Papaver somniferum]|uniref:Uncharacterized protein n=1 Tax=Papaver somniferum TaxID=3469 RepID=A0A4Y7KHW1_PAPSO|nr:hypothetical protein C5167_034732 [Papaver somniferum]